MLEMNICLPNEYKKIDKKLNTTYQILTHLLWDQSKLRASQSAWIKFRDLTCKFEISGIDEDGSYHPYAENACLIDLTEKRIRDLEEYLSRDCDGCPPRK